MYDLIFQQMTTALFQAFTASSENFSADESCTGTAQAPHTQNNAALKIGKEALLEGCHFANTSFVVDIVT